MDYVRFGSTGLTVSRLCLGCMTYGDPGWREWVLNEEWTSPFGDAAGELGEVSGVGWAFRTERMSA